MRFSIAASRLATSLKTGSPFFATFGGFLGLALGGLACGGLLLAPLHDQPLHLVLMVLEVEDIGRGFDETAFVEQLHVLVAHALDIEGVAARRKWAEPAPSLGRRR